MMRSAVFSFRELILSSGERQLAPALDLEIGINDGETEQRRKASQPIPEPIVDLALVDTGAGISCVESGILRQLNPVQVGTVDIVTPHHPRRQARMFMLNFWFMLPTKERLFLYHKATVAEADIRSQGIGCLIGRDVLRWMRFSYDGPGGNFTLEYPCRLVR